MDEGAAARGGHSWQPDHVGHVGELPKGGPADEALAAATQLERDGISVEVIDPRTLRPLDEETIIDSVSKTHRLVIAHEAWKKGGFGAEVAATVQEKAFDELDAPIVRVGAPDVPMPFNDNLERTVIPSQARIEEAIRSLF